MVYRLINKVRDALQAQEYHLANIEEKIEEAFAVPLFSTRKTSVCLSNIFSNFVLKSPKKFSTLYPLLERETCSEYIERRIELSNVFIDNEIKKEKIARSYIKDIAGLIVPHEVYFVAISKDGFPAPYRIQEYIMGSPFFQMQTFWKTLSRQHVEIVQELIQRDLQCYKEKGYHLDIVGFSCDHTPSLFEIAQVYTNPFPKATNLILKGENIAWVDAKTSNLSSSKNIIRAFLLWLNGLYLSQRQEN